MASRRATRSEATSSKRPIGDSRVINLAKYGNDEGQLASGRCLRTLAVNIIRAVAVTADGRFAVSASDDKTLRLWELASGRCLRTLVGHTRPVRAVAVTADGRFAVSGSLDTTLRLWELASGRCLSTLVGHTGWVGAVAVTADGLCLVKTWSSRLVAC